MLKFLRRYQKWMLAIFCVGLMIAFLIPQAASQFAPQPAKRTMATTGDGEKITREMLVKTSNDLQMMRRLALDPVRLPGLTLVPDTGDELDDAMRWTLIQRAAERNKLGASRQESFNLLAATMDVQDEKALEEKAKKLGANGPYLLEVARQYLVAEQYRQLIAGIEFAPNIGTNTQLASPGLQRYFAAQEVRQMIDRELGNPMIDQQAMLMGISPDLLRQQMLPRVLQSVASTESFAKLVGHERVTVEQLRYMLQQQYTELDLTVVLLDAEDRRDTVTVSQEDIDKLFERYADDAPGTGQPYGLGYRVPDRVKLEAMRFPIDAVREAVAKEITPDDIFEFYNNNRGEFLDLSALEEGEAPKPQTLTAVQREQIRLTLTQVRAEQKAVDIARQARQRLNEDGRGLEELGPFKKLPEDFKPTPLVEVAAEIEEEHGVTPQIIQINDWVTSDDIAESATFTSAWINRLPGSTVNLPNPQLGGMLMDQPVSEAVLGGRAGLFASFAPELSGREPAWLSDYVRLAKPFIDQDPEDIEIGVQVGLPGRILADMTRSTYVFRLTATDPAHPRTDPAPIAEELREDAARVAAYEQLIEEKESLLERAAAQSIEQLMTDAQDKQTLTAVTRQTRPGPINSDGEVVIRSNAPILVEAFGVADQIAAGAGLEGAEEKDRLFAVELPGDYKIAIVRLDTVRPLSRSAFEQQAARPGQLTLAARTAPRPADTPSPMSMDALMQATGFKWAEGYGPENLEDEGAEDEEEDGDEE